MGILSSSMLYDCGKSLNPTIDLGQCEGGFMMGVGFFLRERLLQDDVTGKLETDGTWEYKIPCFQDVPVQFDVEFFPKAHEGGIVSSKASGEPSCFGNLRFLCCEGSHNGWSKRVWAACGDFSSRCAGHTQGHCSCHWCSSSQVIS